MDFVLFFVAGGADRTAWAAQCTAAVTATAGAIGKKPTPLMVSPANDVIALAFNADANAADVYSSIMRRLPGGDTRLNQHFSQKLLLIEVRGGLEASDDVWKIAFNLSRR